jgi:hypothetical protein
MSGPARATKLLFAMALAVACGPAPEPQPPSTAPASPDGAGGGRGQAPPSPVSPAGSSTAPSGAPTKTTPPPAPRPMKSIMASQMEAELREIGLDPKALPPLNKMDPAMLRKVMKPFTKALGVPCSHCHDTKSFKAPTTNKKIATHMWNDFVRGLAMADGGALFCDSCHQGTATFLDRSSIPALADWMRENYEAKLVRADKNDHSCETCHGDPFEGKVFAKLWK